MSWKLAVWAVGTTAAAGVMGTLMLSPQALESAPIDRTIFLPGETTDGHYQIELDCNACHGESFADVDTLQASCVECHGAELERVNDSHPRTKFTDPRNADRVEILDARYCVTCHQEHRPEVTTTMGLSLPGDYCFHCHETVGEERPTHAGLAYDSCASAGCHNFHDNLALYEDFLVDHRAEPAIAAAPAVRERELLAWALEAGFASDRPLTAADHDAPSTVAELDRWVAEWEGTAHAKAGVNCSGCHVPESGASAGAWVDAPTGAVCRSCHEAETEGFLAGRHGMRLTAGLGPMRPELARLPMHADAADANVGCNSCHGAHAYDVRTAAVESCLGCHADEHSLAYEGSPHEALWKAELAGEAPAGSGVSCATCHLPRVRTDGSPQRTLVAHNQNDYLRPNEKMIRSSCMQCHGLGFAIDALADPALVASNFRGRPAREVESIHYASVLRWELEGRIPPWARETDEEEPEKRWND